MKQKELYEKTVSILVDAYMNDTLQHGNCYACAIGNLVAANCGFPLIPNPDTERVFIEKFIWDGRIAFWGNVHSVMFRNVNTPGSNRQTVCPEQYTGRAKEEIDATGYSYQETAAIEKAFENVAFEEDEDKYMFNGLMAVINVLDQIHENTDVVITEASKSKFVKATH